MKFLKALARFPLKTTLAIVLLSYLIVRYAPPADNPDGEKSLTIQYGMDPDLLETAEFYPLSSFRMYSKFSPHPNYVYITDGGDKLIAHHRFGALSSAIKKDFDRRLRAIKSVTKVPLREMTVDEKRPAGDATLRHVIDNADPTKVAALGVSTFRLYEVTLGLADGGGIDKVIAHVGEITL